MINTNFGCHKLNDGFFMLPADLYSSPCLQHMMISLHPFPPFNSPNHIDDLFV